MIWKGTSLYDCGARLSSGHSLSPSRNLAPGCGQSDYPAQHFRTEELHSLTFRRRKDSVRLSTAEKSFECDLVCGRSKLIWADDTMCEYFITLFNLWATCIVAHTPFAHAPKSERAKALRMRVCKDGAAREAGVMVTSSTREIQVWSLCT